MLELNPIAVLGYFFGFLGVLATGFFTYRQTKVKAKVEDNRTNIEQVKIEATNKADRIQLETSAETKRIDQLMIAQQQVIDRQDKHLVKLQDTIDSIRTNMENCFSERLDLKLDVKDLKHQAELAEANYQALEAQLKNVQAYYGGRRKDDSISTIEGEIKGEIKPK